jgi:hypothetical protein
MSRSFVYYAVAKQQPAAAAPSRDRVRPARPKPADRERRRTRSIAQRLRFAAPLVARLAHRT